MSAQADRFDYLYRQYINRSCTYEEMQELLQYVSSPEWKDHMAAIADQHLEQLRVPDNLPQIDWEFMYQKIITQPAVAVISMADEASSRRIRHLQWKKIAVAAAITIVLGAAGYWWLVRDRITEVAVTENKPAVLRDVQPGGNKAILTLGDNSSIVLDSAANGKLAQQGNTVINKTKDGELRYEQSGRKYEVAYNTLATPRGGQYQLVLPDGSKVWLNAASSIRYPTAFTGSERKVTVTGEVYFEVAHNVTKPFVVSVDETTIEVLGTHFNINSYSEEKSIRTTLLEGKVRVVAKGQSGVLQPGQQAEWKSEGLAIINDVDIEKTMAWKEGKFLFEHDALPDIMRQISRWYDVDIIYEGTPPANRFSGIISRNRNLSEILSMLAATKNIHFTIEGKKIIVRP